MLSRTDHAQMAVSLGLRRALLLAASAVFVIASLVGTTVAAPVTAHSQTRESATQWHIFFELASTCVTHIIVRRTMPCSVNELPYLDSVAPIAQPPCVASNEQPSQPLPVTMMSRCFGADLEQRELPPLVQCTAIQSAGLPVHTCALDHYCPQIISTAEKLAKSVVGANERLWLLLLCHCGAFSSSIERNRSRVVLRRCSA
jgi:hypothetical protein